jgi:sterol desaturase/sphingolipid hydroxylase (fatty acid hydroxylase superfamily)
LTPLRQVTMLFDLHRFGVLWLETSAVMLGFQLFVSFMLGLGFALLMQRLAPHLKIQSKKPVSTWRDIRREIYCIFWNCAGSSLWGCLIQFLEEQGVHRVDAGPAPWLTVVLPQLMFSLLTYDAYFYAVHRFLLHGRFGWWIHSWHHQSFVSSPLTGAAFHPLETIMTSGFSDVLPMLWPVLFGGRVFTFRAKAVIQLLTLLTTFSQHFGFRFPIADKFLPACVIGSAFHDVHHSKVFCNFGALTTWYDDLLQTTDAGRTRKS